MFLAILVPENLCYCQIFLLPIFVTANLCYWQSVLLSILVIANPCQSMLLTKIVIANPCQFLLMTILVTDNLFYSHVLKLSICVTDNPSYWQSLFTENHFHWQSCVPVIREYITKERGAVRWTYGDTFPALRMTRDKAMFLSFKNKFY